ncbi:MAG: 3-isopropylmalate dehydratase large subunit [Anaerolineae bacterium]
MPTSQTLVEQIIAHAAGHPVRAGDLAAVPVDMAMAVDSIAPSVISVMQEELGVERVFDPERVAVVIDHVAPPSTVAVAEAQARLRRFAAEQGIRHFFDIGRGVCHQVLIEEKLAAPGRIVVGADSHSTSYGAVGALGTGMGASDMALIWATGRTWLRVPETIRVEVRGQFRPGVESKDLALALARQIGADGAAYRVLEFHGLERFTLGQRFTLCNLAVEMGAKAGIVFPSGEVARWFPPPDWLIPPTDASYVRHLAVDLNDLGPQIAVPPRVDQVVDLRDLDQVKVDVVFLGSCTNGRLEDLQTAAHILRGRQVAPGVRLLVCPASARVLEAAVADGTLATLLAAGAVLETPGCGPCLGRHLGVLGAGETCLSTANRNFRGRMGSPEARIYLGSPSVAAATAIAGYITAPEEDAPQRRRGRGGKKNPAPRRFP